MRSILTPDLCLWHAGGYLGGSLDRGDDPYPILIVHKFVDWKRHQSIDNGLRTGKRPHGDAPLKFRDVRNRRRIGATDPKPFLAAQAAQRVLDDVIAYQNRKPEVLRLTTRQRPYVLHASHHPE